MILTLFRDSKSPMEGTFGNSQVCGNLTNRMVFQKSADLAGIHQHRPRASELLAFGAGANQAGVRWIGQTKALSGEDSTLFFHGLGLDFVPEISPPRCIHG